jgi:putative redox protein
MPTVIVQSQENLKQQITLGKHTLIADEPIDAGGNDQGPDPYSILLAALGACTSMTLKLYSKNKHWDLQNVHVTLSIEKIYAKDCEDCLSKEGKIDRITRKIKLEGNLTEEQRSRLLEIARKCPVHKTLTSEVSIVDV